MTATARRITIIVCAALCVCLCLTAAHITAFADGEYTRDATVRDVAVTSGQNSVSVYTDPVDYYEEASQG